MKDKTKQKQKIVVIPTILVFLFSLLSINVFATQENNINFDEQPIAQYYPDSATDEYENGTLIASYNNTQIYASSSSNADVYIFGVKVTSSDYRIYSATETNGKLTFWATHNSDGTNSNLVSVINGNYDSDSNLYYGWSTSSNGMFSNNYSFTIPLYSSDGLYEALADIRDRIDNPPPPPAADHRFAGSLAPGHVAVFDIGGLSDINIVLGTTLFSGYKYSGFSTSQAAGMTSTMPTSISLPLSYTSSISWQGSGQKNLIGQYSNFSFTEHVNSTFSSQYYVVVNPLSGSAPANSTLEASSSNRNNNITILIDKVKSYKTFSLTESFEIDSNGWSEDTSSNGSTTTGTFDDDTGSWSGTNDQTGQPENFNELPVGGGNTPLVGGNNSINDWLQDIANTIKGFFSGAIGAVTTLVSSGSAFINQLAGLYSWLPPAVYSVLVSALVIVITIGVIKVFI